MGLIATVPHLLLGQKQDSLLQKAAEEKLKSDIRPLIEVGQTKRPSRIPLMGILNNAKEEVEGIQKDLKNVQAAAKEIKNLKSNKVKKERQPKGTYMGLKVKQMVLKYEDGKDEVIEAFQILPVYKDPASYIDAKHYFNTKTGKVAHSSSVPKDEALPLHGTYIKRINNKVVEKGQYYVGTKHGRWEKFHKKEGHLVQKEVFHKGLPSESLYLYYDEKKTKIKEIIGVVDRYKNGQYIAFFPNGTIKERGYYQEDVRIKTWTEYHENGVRKREVKYADDFTQGNVQPTVLKEYDQKGKVIK